jgi:hypothetical protein
MLGFAPISALPLASLPAVGTTNEAGGYDDDKKKRKKRFFIDDQGTLRVYRSQAEALDALDAIQDATDKAPEEAPEAPASPQVPPNAPTGHYEALLALFEQQREEEDIEMLLLAA